MVRQDVTLTGTGPEGIATVSAPTPIHQQINIQSRPETLTITDTGNEALNGINVSILSSAYSGDFTLVPGGTLGTSLAQNANGTINFAFTPSTSGITETAVLQITSADGPTQDVTLTGTGVNTVPTFSNSLVSSPTGTFLTTASSLVSTVASEILAVGSDFINSTNLVSAGTAGDNLAAGQYSFLNYNLFLSSVINANDVNISLGNDGNHTIAANTSPLPSVLPSDGMIDFDGMSYNLYNGAAGNLSSGYYSPQVTLGTPNNLIIGADFNSLYSIYHILDQGNGNDILIGGINSGSGANYELIAGKGNNILVGGATNGDNQSHYFLDASASLGNNILVEGINTATYTLEGGHGNNIFFAANSSGVTNYNAEGTGINTLSFINVTESIRLNVGDNSSQASGGDGKIGLGGNFSILQGTLTGGDFIGDAQSNSITDKSVYGMGPNDTLVIQDIGASSTQVTGNTLEGSTSLGDVGTNVELLVSQPGTMVTGNSLIGGGGANDQNMLTINDPADVFAPANANAGGVNFLNGGIGSGDFNTLEDSGTGNTLDLTATGARVANIERVELNGQGSPGTEDALNLTANVVAGLNSSHTLFVAGAQSIVTPDFVNFLDFGWKNVGSINGQSAIKMAGDPLIEDELISPFEHYTNVSNGVPVNLYVEKGMPAYVDNNGLPDQSLAQAFTIDGTASGVTPSMPVTTYTQVLDALGDQDQNYLSTIIVQTIYSNTSGATGVNLNAHTSINNLSLSDVLMEIGTQQAGNTYLEIGLGAIQSGENSRGSFPLANISSGDITTGGAAAIEMDSSSGGQFGYVNGSTSIPSASDALYGSQNVAIPTVPDLTISEQQVILVKLSLLNANEILMLQDNPSLIEHVFVVLSPI